MRHRSTTLALAIAVALSLPPLSLARAQTSPELPARGVDEARERSRAAFASGARALEEGRAKEALALFREAYRLYPHWATFYNIGLCERALGRPLEAVEAFLRFLDEGGDQVAPDKVDAVAQLIAEAESKIARVSISVPVADAAIRLDGAPVAAGAEVRVNPGEHVVEATAPGRAAAREVFDAKPGVRVTVRVELPPEERPPTSRTGPLLDGWFWATAGVSAGAIAAGAITGAVALSDAAAYADPATPNAEARDRRARGESLRVVADVCFGTALVSGAAAVLLATLRSRAPDGVAARVAAAPGSISLFGRF